MGPVDERRGEVDPAEFSCDGRSAGALDGITRSSEFFVDTNGDGQLELDPDQQAMNPVQPVHWKVIEWD